MITIFIRHFVISEIKDTNNVHHLFKHLKNSRDQGTNSRSNAKSCSPKIEIDFLNMQDPKFVSSKQNKT